MITKTTMATLEVEIPETVAWSGPRTHFVAVLLRSSAKDRYTRPGVGISQSDAQAASYALQGSRPGKEAVRLVYDGTEKYVGRAMCALLGAAMDEVQTMSDLSHDENVDLLAGLRKALHALTPECWS